VIERFGDLGEAPERDVRFAALDRAEEGGGDAGLLGKAADREPTLRAETSDHLADARSGGSRAGLGSHRGEHIPVLALERNIGQCCDILC